MFFFKRTARIYLVLLLMFIVTVDAFSQDDPYLALAETMPVPIGGMKAVYSHIVYPEIAKSNGIKGKVYLLVYINENGSIDDIKLLKGIGGGCNEAALSSVKFVKFTPGQNNGKPVKVKLAMAINFG